MNRARYVWVVFLFTLVGLLAIISPRSVGAQEMPSLFPLEDIASITLYLETDTVLPPPFPIRNAPGYSADVYFPDVSASKKDAFPIVAVLQGAGVVKGFYSGFGTQLARFGFVVVIPNRSPVPFPFLPDPFPDEFVIWDVLAQMETENMDNKSRLFRIIDTDRMGLAGHSAGGAASLFAIDGICQFPFCGPPPPPPPAPPPFIPFPLPPAVEAGAFYGTNTCGAGGELTDERCEDPFGSPVPNPDGMIFGIDNGNIPVALIQGSVDGISTPDEAQATFDNLDGLRELITIDGANHYGITNFPNAPPPNNDPNESTIPQEESIEQIADAVGPFLRTYLAIAVDSVSYAAAQTQNLAWSHTVAAGNDQLLMVGTSHIDENKLVTGVTYGDIPLTRLGVQPGDNFRMEMWYLIAPPSGLADIVVSLSDESKIVGGAVSFNGVDQKTPFGVFVSAEDKTATASVTVASGPRELVFTVVATSRAANSLTVDGGQTQLWNTETGKLGNDIRGAGSSVPEASLVTMTLGNQQPWAIGAVPLKPADAP